MCEDIKPLKKMSLYMRAHLCQEVCGNVRFAVRVFHVDRANTNIMLLLRSSSDDRILWIRSGIEIMWLIEHVANGGQLLM